MMFGHPSPPVYDLHLSRWKFAYEVEENDLEDLEMLYLKLCQSV